MPKLGARSRWRPRSMFVHLTHCCQVVRGRHWNKRRHALMQILMLCLVIVGCKQTAPPVAQRPATAAGPVDPHATKAAIDEMFDLRSHPKASIAHTIDPHAMTDSQVKFGIAPTRDPAVEYQPDIILMEQGDKAIKAIASDGITWTFDANAPQVSEFQEGKVVFATSRAVGRVLSIQRSGDTEKVILGPVQITDVIRNGDFAMDQAIDMNNMISYVAPRLSAAAGYQRRQEDNIQKRIA